MWQATMFFRPSSITLASKTKPPRRLRCPGRVSPLLFEAKVIEDGRKKIVVFHHQIGSFSGGDFTGVAKNQGNANRGFVSVDWAGMVTHAPVTAMACIKTLIGAEHDERVFVEAQLF